MASFDPTPFRLSSSSSDKLVLESMSISATYKVDNLDGGLFDRLVSGRSDRLVLRLLGHPIIQGDYPLALKDVRMNHDIGDQDWTLGGSFKRTVSPVSTLDLEFEVIGSEMQPEYEPSESDIEDIVESIKATLPVTLDPDVRTYMERLVAASARAGIERGYTAAKREGA